MNCKGCEHFHIRQHPIKAEGGGYWDLGLAECKKHDVVASFGPMRQIDKLTCIEEAHNGECYDCWLDWLKSPVEVEG